MEDKEKLNLPKINESEVKKPLKKDSVKTNVKKKEEKIKPVIYMGPTVPGNILISGKIYKNLPEYVLDFISKNPVFGELIIDVEKLPQFKSRVDVRGTGEYSLYFKCLEIIDKGGML